MIRSLSTAMAVSALFAQLLPAQVTQFGAACPSGNATTPQIAVLGAPFAGSPFTIEVTGPPGKTAYLILGFSNTTWGGTPLPFSFAPFGSPGCQGFVAPDFTVSLPLDAQGRASVPIPPVLPAGGRLFAQALILFGNPGLLDGATEAIEIVAMPLSSGPTIASLSVLSGGAGDEVIVRGANFGSGPPTNVCMAVADASDDIQAFLKVTAKTTTEMRATIKAVRPGAVAGRLGFINGTGQTAALPNIPGATATRPAWNWGQAAVTPANMGMSSQQFLPTERLDAGGGCAPCADGYAWFDEQNGQFTATLPDLCDGVRFGVVASEFWWYDQQGNYHRIEYQVEEVWTCGMNDAARANYLAFMLSFRLAQYGLQAFAPNATTIQISVAGGLALSGGTFALSWYYDPATRVATTSGQCDDFASPTEPTSPGAALLAVKAANWPTAVLGDYDEPSPNRFLLDTLPIPAGPGTTIVGMSLHLHLRSNNSQSSNDSVHLVIGGTSFQWSRNIRDLPGAGGTWGSSQVLDVCLDLSALPLAGGGTIDLLAAIEANGALDLMIQDDTTVDCATLTVQRCQ